MTPAEFDQLRDALKDKPRELPVLTLDLEPVTLINPGWLLLGTNGEVGGMARDRSGWLAVRVLDVVSLREAAGVRAEANH